MPDTIAQRVIDAISKAKKIPPESISLDSTFEELKIDSLDGLNLFFELEEMFDITIPDDSAKGMRTVRDVVDGLERLRSGTESAGAGAEAPR